MRGERGYSCREIAALRSDAGIMFSAARASKIYLPVNVSSRLGYRRELEGERFKVTTGRGGGRAHLRHLRRGQIYQPDPLGATSFNPYTGTLLWRCSGKVGAMARGGARQRSEFQHFQGKRGKEPRGTREPTTAAHRAVQRSTSFRPRLFLIFFYSQPSHPPRLRIPHHPRWGARSHFSTLDDRR